jgi:hypothetical protein
LRFVFSILLAAPFIKAAQSIAKLARGVAPGTSVASHCT